MRRSTFLKGAAVGLFALGTGRLPQFTEAPATPALSWPEGTFLHLDGGVLELGLVRDSTINSANDYMVFSETFEAAARA